MLKEINVNEKFINTLEITPSRLILLSTTNQFYVLGWGGIKPLGAKTPGYIRSFAFTPDKLLMVLQNNELCGMDTIGNLSKLFNLPNDDMGISAGKYVMYIYDDSDEKTKHSIYLIAPGGRYTKLFEIPTTINSVVEYGNSLLLASENGVFRYNPKENELKVFAALPDDRKIKSLAVDSANNRIYFSTENEVYALKDSNAVIISDQFGGLLKYFNGGLLVFNSEKKFVIRVLGLEDNIALKKQEMRFGENNERTSSMLNNSVIINLLKIKVPDYQIIDLINSSPVNFNTSVDSMIYLSGQNVSSQVILAMRNAMKMKSKPINNTDSTDTGNKIITNNQAVQNVTTSVAESTPAYRFYIITGSYPTEQQANEAVSDLKRKGFTGAEVVGKSSSGSFRIASKGYATNEEAMKDLEEIRQTVNSSAWIFEKK